MLASVQSKSADPRKLKFRFITKEMIMKTDEQLKDDVAAELRWSPSINASQIGVEVKNGIVTLAGSVASYSEKLEAEHVTQRVSGVKALAVQLDVKLANSSERTDADIALTAKNVIQWLSIIPSDAVKVMVENGWITLTGDLEWKYQQVAAVVAVRYLMGVKGVFDQIQIIPKLTPKSLKADIEQALQRNTSNDVKNITVQVDGTDVTLSGKVNNWDERSAIRKSAWAAPGVSKVIDNMVMAY